MGQEYESYKRALQYLDNVERIDNMIAKKQEQIDSLRSLASSTALHTDSERVQSSGSKDKLGDCCAKIADLCAEMKRDIDFFVNTKADVMHRIDQLESIDERQVLYCRYLQFMKFRSIAQEMNVSESTVFRLHKAAVTKMSAIITS